MTVTMLYTPLTGDGNYVRDVTIASLDVTVCRLSSLLVVMVNARLFVSASDDSTV